MIKRFSLLFILIFVNFPLFAQKTKAPFKEINFRGPTGQGRLFGTLALPTDSNTNTLCIIVPGSGPTDRNGNTGSFVFANSYKFLSDSLAKHVYPVLRFDKRGVGESRYVYNSETELRFGLYVQDLNLIINRARKIKGIEKIVLIGHSEGATVALMAALRDSVHAYVSLCGPGQSADSLILTQLKTQPLSIQNEALEIIKLINMGKTTDKVSEPLMALFRPSIQAYLKSWFDIHPDIEISQLNIPTFIIQGATDIQVSVQESKRLAKAKPDADYVIISDMNHVLKKASDNRSQNIRTYGDPYQPLHPELTPLLLEFLKKL